MFVGGQAAWSPWPRGSWVCLGTAPGSPCQHFPGLSIAASPGVSLPGCPHPTTAPSHACPVKPMQPTPKPRTGPSPCLGAAATSSWVGLGLPGLGSARSRVLLAGLRVSQHPGWGLGRLGTAVALSPWPERQDDAPQAVSMAAAAWSKRCEVWAAGGPPPCFPLLETSSSVPSWCAPASRKGHCGPLQSATRGQGPLAPAPCSHQAPRLAAPAWGCRALYGRAPTSPGLGWF